MINISFYKFVELKNLPDLKIQLLNFCNEKNLKGKILLANEGINGYLSGDRENLEKFKQYILSFSFFNDLYFKENPICKHNFKRMIVKIKKEIITFKIPVNINKKAPHIKPEELKKLYENNENFVIIDTRNDYEYDIGHFKNAIKLNTKQFSDFPQELEKIKEKIKDKKIITYCTGGIRCEKATAYMKDIGYKEVFQLDGGIINYGIKCGGDFWNGKCFVFDERGAIDLDINTQKENLEYSQCSICYVPNESTHSCPYCKKTFLMCSKCLPLMDNCCSKFCRNKQREKHLLNNNQEVKIR